MAFLILTMSIPSPASIEHEADILEIGHAIVLGAVFGKCGIGGGSLTGFVDGKIASPIFLREKPFAG